MCFGHHKQMAIIVLLLNNWVNAAGWFEFNLHINVPIPVGQITPSVFTAPARANKSQQSRTMLKYVFIILPVINNLMSTYLHSNHR